VKKPWRPRLREKTCSRRAARQPHPRLRCGAFCGAARFHLMQPPAMQPAWPTATSARSLQTVSHAVPYYLTMQTAFILADSPTQMTCAPPQRARAQAPLRASQKCATSLNVLRHHALLLAMRLQKRFFPCASMLELNRGGSLTLRKSAAAIVLASFSAIAAPILSKEAARILTAVPTTQSRTRSSWIAPFLSHFAALTLECTTALALSARMTLFTSLALIRLGRTHSVFSQFQA